MRLRYSEDPKEWRKLVLLTAPALGVFATLLRWKGALPGAVWILVLLALIGAAIGAGVRPRWFRGYYRLSQTLGFYFSLCVGYVILTFFFLLIITPLGWGLRLLGKDLLSLNRVRHAATYWKPAREKGPLDRLF